VDAPDHDRLLRWSTVAVAVGLALLNLVLLAWWLVHLARR